MSSTVYSLACTSFFLALLSYFWACVSMYKGTTEPSIISRFFWFILSISNFLSYYSLDSGTGIFLALSGMIGAGVMFGLTLKYGYIEFKRSDLLTCAGACIAFICYLCVPIKIIALLSGLLTHLISGVPTYRRINSNPYAENLTSWLIFSIASTCSFLAVIFEGKNMIFPLYFLLFDSGVALLIFLKHRHAKSASTESLISFVFKTA
jgi:hypothetical protein